MSCAVDAPLSIGMMCKAPRLGLSKTRLAQSIGPDAALMLSAAFTADTANVMRSVGLSGNIMLHAFYKPADAQAEVSSLIGPDILPHFCDAPDLGTAMWQALQQMLLHTSAGAVLIGSDLPTLPAQHVREAVAALRAMREGAVIGPSDDGGYYLIGVRGLETWPLFAPMHWSTPDVLAETRRRAIQHRLDLVETKRWRDIDDVQDLEWLCAGLELDSAPAPATRRALAALRKKFRL